MMCLCLCLCLFLVPSTVFNTEFSSKERVKAAVGSVPVRPIAPTTATTTIANTTIILTVARRCSDSK
jgi:hypothetical protein